MMLMQWVVWDSHQSACKNVTNVIKDDLCTHLPLSEPLKADHDLLSIEDIVDTLSITSAAGLRRPRFRTAAKKNKKKKG